MKLRPTPFIKQVMKYMGSHLKQMCLSVTQAVLALSSKGKQGQQTGQQIHRRLGEQRVVSSGEPEMRGLVTYSFTPSRTLAEILEE